MFAHWSRLISWTHNWSTLYTSPLVSSRLLIGLIDWDKRKMLKWYAISSLIRSRNVSSNSSARKTNLPEVLSLWIPFFWSCMLSTVLMCSAPFTGAFEGGNMQRLGLKELRMLFTNAQTEPTSATEGQQQDMPINTGALGLSLIWYYLG